MSSNGSETPLSLDTLSEASPIFMEPGLRRSKTADDIQHIRRRNDSFVDIPIHAASEGHKLVTTPTVSIEAHVSLIEREILSSRSLFDPRWIPPSPEEISLADELDTVKRSRWTRFSLHMIRMVRIVQHFFIFLQLGIVTALIWAKVDLDSYTELWGGGANPHDLTVHFFVNDVFMTFFFGIAMVHVTTSLRPGGSLYPFNKAATPLLGTLGGVVGPTLVYLALVAAEGNWKTQSQGWAVTIATDISVAWLVSSQVFKSGTHPAVEFLLLLAVADDVVGLVVIAVAFPSQDMHLIWLLLVAAAVAASALFRFLLKVELWFFYVFLAGPISWFGLYKAGLHPALALCVVVPFIPGRNIEKFDHSCSLFVHIGLFFFALCNAGVEFNAIGIVTLNVSLSLIAGKTLGIFIFTYLGTLVFRLKLPDGMGRSHLGLVAHISGVGLTVALFVAELAFKDPELRDQARLGALLSAIVAPTSIIISRFVKVSPKTVACSSDAVV